MGFPAFICCRDRVTDLANLVAWLERAGFDRVTLLDNGSTWEPMLEYLDATPHEVVRLGDNLGSRAIWLAELVPGEPYVYTDPDVLPTEECPLDAVDRLAFLLDRYPAVPKVALGLKLDDVRDDLPCLSWERDLVSPQRQVEHGVFNTISDTTFALHRANAPFRYDALRTGAPYQVRHLPWYRTELTDEDRWYLERARGGAGGSSWRDELAGRSQLP